MTFDPDAPLDSQDQADAYVRWCAFELLKAADEGPEATPRTYASAMRAAAWLWVIAQARMRLADEIEDDREGHERNLAGLFRRARECERGKGDVEFNMLSGARVALDCFESAGRFGETLLTTAKVAVEALQLVFMYPPIDKWETSAPGPWSLILCGAVLLEEINTAAETLTVADYAVRPSPGMVGKIAWDAAHRTAQRVGAEPPSPN
jgi:hypothetical protein